MLHWVYLFSFSFPLSPNIPHVTYFTLVRPHPPHSLTSSILLTQIRKPPDVAQPHRVPDDAEEELHLAGPGSPVRLVCVDDDMLLHLCRVRVVQGCALWRRQDYGHTMTSVTACSRIKRCHFVATIFQCGRWRGHLMPKSLSLTPSWWGWLQNRLEWSGHTKKTQGLDNFSLQTNSDFAQWRMISSLSAQVGMTCATALWNYMSTETDIAKYTWTFTERMRTRGSCTRSGEYFSCIGEVWDRMTLPLWLKSSLKRDHWVSVCG